MTDTADKTRKSPASEKAKTRFARTADAPAHPAEPGDSAEPADAAVPVSELLERLEAQAAKLTQARLRGQQLEKALRAQIEKHKSLEAQLETEREHSAQLAEELARRYQEVRAGESAGREAEELEHMVAALQQELDSTRMQLDAVRGELVAKGRMSQRLRPRSWR